MSFKMAYRGFLNTYPENTMVAFESAIKEKAEGIHCDVAVLFDGTCIVHRDVPLGRCEDKKGHIYDYRRDTFQSFSVGEVFSDKYADERIPFFEDVVKLAKNNGIILGVEITYDARPDICFVNDVITPVMEILEKYDMKNSCYITSFNHIMLKEIKEKYPNYKTLITFLSDHNLDITEYTLQNCFDGVHCHINYISEKFAKKLKENNLFLSLYGIRETEKYEFAKQLNADYINTDNIIGG